MPDLRTHKLSFHFSDVDPDARMNIIFHRTLRIPDDGKSYPLPPSLGTFPIAQVDDYRDKVPEAWVKHGGVMLPMWQSEAMWIQFEGCIVPGHGHVWPFAVKVSTGKCSAVTGEPWSEILREGDYLVIPGQKWLDGYVVENGIIRQFVAAPLGMGASAEEQITGKAEFGGLQIEVYPMMRAEFEKRWPKIPEPSKKRVRTKGAEYKSSGEVESWSGPIYSPLLSSDNISLDSSLSEVDDKVIACSASVPADPAAAAGPMRKKNVIRPDMGLAPGGRMVQQVFSDSYGYGVWDKNFHDRCFIHLANSLAWKSITGNDAPTIPLSSNDYSRYGYPWFDYYKDAQTVEVSGKLASLKSAVQVGSEKGVPIVLENESAQPKKIVVLGNVRNGDW